MRLATFSRHDGPEAHVGVVLGSDRILDLTASVPGEPAFRSMLDLIAGGPAARERARREVHRSEGDGSGDGTERAPAVVPLDEVRLLAPIPRPAKNVFCVGMNYRSHVDDNARALGLRPEIGSVPLFFTKPPTAVVGPGEPILFDGRLTAKLDYEVELAVVIGRGGTWIDEATALDHVFGYTVANDVSARDLQWRTSQMFIGKGLDSYCPLGPWIVEADDLSGGERGPATQIRCVVNGELRQRDSTAAMLFSVATIIAELSKGLTLEPGDLIITGTPGGCGYQRQPPEFLGPGDVVECAIDGIGALVNPVADWAEAATRRPGRAVLEEAVR